MDDKAAAGLEGLARLQAWEKFKHEALFSLYVWKIDGSLRGQVESPVEWLRRCSRELDDILGGI